LFGRIVKETTATLKVRSIIGGATGVFVGAEKGFGHGELGNKCIGHGFAVGQGTSADIHVTGLLGNVFGRRAPGIKRLIECAERGLFVNGGGITTGWIKGTAGGEDHVFRRHGCGNGGSTCDVIFTDFDPWTELFG